jgi:hypothetical protein
MLAAISSRFFEISSPNGLDVQYDSLVGIDGSCRLSLPRPPAVTRDQKVFLPSFYLENWVSRCVVLVEEDRWLVGRCTSNVQEQVV